MHSTVRRGHITEIEIRVGPEGCSLYEIGSDAPMGPAEGALEERLKSTLSGECVSGRKVRIWAPADLEDPLETLDLGAELGPAALHSSISPIRRGGRLDVEPRPLGSVLLAWADPATGDAPELPDIESEVRAVQRALRTAECRALQVDELPYATPASLLRSLERSRPDVLHFIGHGASLPSGGALVLESGKAGEAAYLYESELAEALLASETRLALLSACHTAGTGSLGAAVATAGIPAVVAMRFAIRDDTAALFSRAFYSAMLDGLAIDDAVRQGRLAVRMAGTEWASPTLYLSCAPESLWSSEAPPLEAEPERPRHNLTLDERPFIGRQKERADLRRKLREQRQALVTITGMGGMGKTRLAKQVATELLCEYPDGVWLVECDNLSDGGELVTAIALATGLGAPAGDPLKTVQEGLQSMQALLLLDCFEGIVEQAPVVEQILARAPNLQVLVTSRRVLGLPREFEYALSPMDVLAGRSAPGDALNLFIEAAAHADDRFQLGPKNKKRIAEICHKLEGVPLALILAAGRLRYLSLEELLDALEERSLDVLKRRAVGKDRHADLQRVIEGSFLLLQPEDRRLLHQLSVFAGSFAMDDVLAVCALDRFDAQDGLATLRDHSLIQVQTAEKQTRYKLLDTVREYLGRMQPDEEDAIEREACRGRHARHYAELAKRVGDLMNEGRLAVATEIIFRDLGNFRAAVETCSANNEHALTATFARSLSRSLFEAGLGPDFEKLAFAARLAAKNLPDRQLLADTLGLEGAYVARKGDEDECRRLWTERVELCQEIGDPYGQADALTDLAWQAVELGHAREGRLRLLEALRLARAVGSPGLVATARVMQARMALQSGDRELALRRARQCEAILPECEKADLTFFVLQALARTYTDLSVLNDAKAVSLLLLTRATASRRPLYVAWALLELSPIYQAHHDQRLAALCLLGAQKVCAEYSNRYKDRSRTQLTQFKKDCDETVQAMMDAHKTTAWVTIVRLIGELDGGR